jgi:hypothetical protein
MPLAARRDRQGRYSAVISQVQAAPTICKLLGIPIPKTMKAPVIG